MRAITLSLALFLGMALSAQGELRIATGITPAQNIFNRILPTFEKATGLKLVLVDARSPAAWDMLDKGQVDAAAGGLTWEDWLKSIKEKGLRVPTESEVRRFQIGADLIQVLTNGDTVVMTLDKDQLIGIFTGKIRNWKEVGGDDAPIKVILDTNQIATNDTFRGKILGGAAFGADTLPVPKGRTILQAIEATPRSVGFAPKASIQCLTANSPVTPDVSRPILLLIKGQTPTPEVQKLMDFLVSAEGQKLVVK